MGTKEIIKVELGHLKPEKRKQVVAELVLREAQRIIEEGKMQCDNCGKGYPTFHNKHGNFCNFSCFLQWKKKKER